MGKRLHGGVEGPLEDCAGGLSNGLSNSLPGNFSNARPLLFYLYE